MIIRSAFRCLTCDQDHVVRIGMGHDDRQEHRFPCRGCGEEMVIALNVNYDDHSAMPEAIENALLTKEASGALVINVHANYVIDGAERYADRTFPHMNQMHAHHEAAERFGSLRPVTSEDITGGERPRPFRRPDFADEWRLLRKAWSLHTRGKSKLSVKEIVVGSERYHVGSPLKDLPDWIWRFSMFLGALKYEKVLRAMMAEVKDQLTTERFAPMLAEYAKGTETRARRYFEVLRDYFSAWSELSQVHFAVAKGIPVAQGHVATTSGFNSVRMFYGSAFEAFAPSVDILAFMNNVLEGREWDRFRTIDAETYLRSDKAKRFDAFAERAAFSELCEEHDSQLRNASHHGSLHFDGENGTLSYRAGKGSAGDLVTIPYAEYLSRCSVIFFQMITLLRFELLVCRATGTDPPV